MILNLNVPVEFNIHFNFSKIQRSFLMTFRKLWVSKSFDNVTYFKYVATKTADQNCMREKTKKGLKYGKVWYSSVQNVMSYSLLSKI